MHATSDLKFRSLCVVAEARRQLEAGTEIAALIEVVGALRDLDPENPMIFAIEARIKRASQNSLMAVRAKLSSVASGTP